MTQDLDDLLLFALEKNASDLFVKANSAPCLRVNGKIVHTEFPILTVAEAHRLCYSKMSARQQAIFEQHHEMDLAFEVQDVLRIRMNVYNQRGATAGVCRLIPKGIKSLEELGIPPKVKDFCQHRNGLVLITGPTGCGKTTTLAAMIDLINQNRSVNIITVEDPIEFTHPDKTAIVSQREIGLDTDNFQQALRHILRQAPDIILIGEMRDIETMNVALQAAETGHLVFATVHTSSAAETLDRISNMFQPHERPMLWLRLAVSLRGVLSQKLVPKANGEGRACAVEVMDVTPTISKLLEEGKSDEIYTAIRQAGLEAYWGMQTMNQCLLDFYTRGVITEKDALNSSGIFSEMKQLIRMAQTRGDIDPVNTQSVPTPSSGSRAPQIPGLPSVPLA